LQLEKATFAAGCFWGVEHAFRQIEGVTNATCGYTGGHNENPTYQDVCSDQTGHAEAVELEFDADRISYKDLVKAFWQMHDATTLNRQGPDVGSQYRSAIYYHSPEQQATALESRDRTQKRLLDPIVTEIVPAAKFWPAEDYHQQYFEKRGIAVCH
jgi:peptide-methionine (S)-S-oxide reductase